jgi:hypothetical protein
VPTSPLWVERNIVVPTTIRYWLTGNIAKKLTQAKNFSTIRLLGQLFGLQGLLETDLSATF